MNVIQSKNMWSKVKYDPKHFKNFLTEYFDNLEKPYPPEIPEKCKDSNQRQHCFMHSFFYDEKKLKKKWSNGFYLSKHFSL